VGRGGPGRGGGGVLVAKNRDWTPDSQGRLDLALPKEGHPYLALMAKGAKGWGVRAGVNRDGRRSASACFWMKGSARDKAPPAWRALARIFHEGWVALNN